MKGCVRDHSSAANGIVHRQGCGKVKHLECRQLWAQEIVGEGEVNNPADALTHYWRCEDGRRHFEKLSPFKPKL